jgi:hypothetical protein
LQASIHRPLALLEVSFQAESFLHEQLPTGAKLLTGLVALARGAEYAEENQRVFTISYLPFAIYRCVQIAEEEQKEVSMFSLLTANCPPPTVQVGRFKMSRNCSKTAGTIMGVNP